MISLCCSRTEAGTSNAAGCVLVLLVSVETEVEEEKKEKSTVELELLSVRGGGGGGGDCDTMTSCLCSAVCNVMFSYDTILVHVFVGSPAVLHTSSQLSLCCHYTIHSATSH